jgi:two-component system response regulator HydG
MKDKKKLLIADDDIAHRTMLRILLDWQYDIFEADDGSTAIELAAQRDLPGISGIEALDRIRSYRPYTPILIMTAYFSDEIANQAKEKGAFGCLGKPFDFEELKLTMERAIISWQSRNSAVL